MAELISVTEYAKLHNKDCGNVRRMLAAGRLQGRKIGSQWVIDADAEYPSDRREKDGTYRRWRQRIAFNRNKELVKALDDMIPDLRDICGSVLSSVILYGSYARGTQSEDSDVDIALMLDRKPDRKMTDRMTECVASYELSCGKVLSVIDIERELYNKWSSTLPFYRNIANEGIVLWSRET